MEQAPASGGEVDKGSSVVIFVGVFSATEGLENQAPASP